MNNLNEIIQPKRENVTSVVSKLRDDTYFVDSSFQRKMIWTRKQKVKLIETILMGYPMPEIYLWAQKSDPITGKQRFSIVDGQQRLTTIRQFVEGEWPLTKSALQKENIEEPYVNKDWSSLSTELKQKIWEYNIDVREIPSSLDVKLIHKVFSRLNQTDKSLNPQELRNAEFHGEFIKASADIANTLKNFGWKIFSDNDVRRMKDVDFSSQLLSYLIEGFANTSPTAMIDLYDKYNDKYPKRELHYKQASSIFKKIVSLFEQASVVKFFSKTVHFYTLFSVIDIAGTTGVEITAEKLSSFVREYENADFDNPETDTILMDYKRGSSSTTAGKANRERRAFSLLKYLQGIK